MGAGTQRNRRGCVLETRTVTLWPRRTTACLLVGERKQNHLRILCFLSVVLQDVMRPSQTTSGGAPVSD